MRAFELYFEQKNKDEVFLQSFVCEPENIYQQKLGHLYMVGELNQALPPNAHFLSNLALAIKQAYYSQSLKKSPETSLREALKKGNEFLEKESKKGNVEWLGNLNFAVLSFKDHILNFAKTGTFKIFLLRTEENIDLSQSLEVELKSPDPLRVFSSMAGGKLSSDDKVVVVNKKVISLFKKKNNFIDQLSHASTSKELKQVIKKNQEVLSEASGVCLFLTQNYEVKEEQTVTMHSQVPRFSFRKVFIKPIITLFNVFGRFRIKLPVFKIPSFKTPSFKKPQMKRLVIPRMKAPHMPKINLTHFKIQKKQVIPVLGLILVLFAFNFIFSGEKAENLRKAENLLKEAETKAILAESLLMINQDEKAEVLFKEALETLAPLTKRKHPLRQEALSLKKSIEDKLK